MNQWYSVQDIKDLREMSGGWAGLKEAVDICKASSNRQEAEALVRMRYIKKAVSDFEPPQEMVWL